MTVFDSKKFTKSGPYVSYEGKFVVRFKYRNTPIKWRHFKSFLINNITVEDYFAALDNGVAPLEIMRRVAPNLYNHLIETHSY